MSDFRPADSFRSPRFAQPVTFMRLPHTSVFAGLDVALLGIPFDVRERGLDIVQVDLKCSATSLSGQEGHVGEPS